MKFKKYITESEGYDESILNDIITDCHQYIKDFKTIWRGNFFYSGRGGSASDISKRSVRHDRKPKDTPTEIHNAISNWFHKKFGVPARSGSVFISIDSYVAGDYGSKLYIILPVGSYFTISSNSVPDMYTDVVQKTMYRYNDKYVKHIVNNVSRLWNEVFSTEDKSAVIDDILNVIENSNYRRNLLNDGNEQMLICEEYYCISSRMLDKHMYNAIFK